MKTYLVPMPSISFLTPHIVAYVAEKRALGAGFETESYALRLLDRFVVAHRLQTMTEIDPAFIARFMESRPRHTARSFNHLRAVLRAFFHRLVRHSVCDRNPLQIPKRRIKDVPRPFIFSPEQAKHLLETARALPDKDGFRLRGETYRSAFALLYGLGMRIGEARRLIVSDVDFETATLLIRESKFGKTRQLPFGPRVGTLLREYLDKKTHAGLDVTPDSALFSNRHGQALSATAFKRTFRSIVTVLEFHPSPGVAFPRPHHLRHSFAVGRLLRWYRQGADVAVRLHSLSTFLGHVDPSSTQVYLTITADLLAEAGDRFERFAQVPSASHSEGESL